MQFLSYVRTTLDALDNAVLAWMPSGRTGRKPYSFTTELGWVKDLRRSQEIIRAVQAGSSHVHAAILRASLIREGVVLT
jgi:hypothetical protein